MSPRRDSVEKADRRSPRGKSVVPVEDDAMDISPQPRRSSATKGKKKKRRSPSPGRVPKVVRMRAENQVPGRRRTKKKPVAESESEYESADEEKGGRGSGNEEGSASGEDIVEQTVVDNKKKQKKTGLKRGRSQASAVGRRDKGKRSRSAKEDEEEPPKDSPLEFKEATADEEEGSSKGSSDNSSDVVDRLIDEAGGQQKGKDETEGTAKGKKKILGQEKEVTQEAAATRDPQRASAKESNGKSSKGVKGTSSRRELALSIARPTSGETPANGSQKVQTKLAGSPVRPGVRMAATNLRSRPTTSVFKRLMASTASSRLLPMSRVIDLTSDEEGAVRRTEGNPSAAGAQRGDQLRNEPSGATTDAVVPYHIPRLYDEDVPKLMRSIPGQQTYSGPPGGDAVLRLRPPADGRQPQGPSSGVPMDGVTEPGVRVELLDSPSSGHSGQPGAASMYPERLRMVFCTPPPDHLEGFAPFDMMTDCAPIIPPVRVDREAPPLSTANLRANWCTDALKVSLADLARWPYAKADVRRFIAEGVDHAESRFKEYTDCIGTLYAIPPNLMADRTFLLHPEHAQYVELATQYLAGDTLASPLTESNLYSLPLPRQDARSPLSRAWTGTRAANHARGIIMDVSDWVAFATSDGRGRARNMKAAEIANQNDVRMAAGVTRTSFPVWPTRLREFMAPLGPPLVMPPIALYFGVAAETFTPEAKDRYLKELQFELAAIHLITAAYEVRYSRRVHWYSPELVNLIEETVQGAPNFLERGQTVGAGVDSLQAIIEVMRKAQASPASFFCQGLYDGVAGPSRYCGYEVRDGTTFRHSTSYGAQVAHHRTTVPDTMLQSREHIRRAVMQDGRLGTWALGDLLSRLEDTIARLNFERRRGGAANRARAPDGRQVADLEREIQYWKSREESAGREVHSLSSQLSEARTSHMRRDHEMDRLRCDLLDMQERASSLARDKDSADRKLAIKESEHSLARQRCRQYRAELGAMKERAEGAERKATEVEAKLAEANSERKAGQDGLEEVKKTLAAAEEKMASLRAERNLWRDQMISRYGEQQGHQHSPSPPFSFVESGWDGRPSGGRGSRPGTPFRVPPSTPRPGTPRRQAPPSADGNPYDSE